MIKIFTSLPISSGSEFKPDSYNLHHLKVTRISRGDEVLIGDSREKEFLARVGENYTLRIIRESSRQYRPPLQVVLFAALLKKKKYEEVIFKCSQLGVVEFIPLLTSRTVKTVRERSKSKTYERWRRKARHGSELSMREKIPSIREPVKFAHALELYKEKNFDSGIFLYEEEKQNNFIKKGDFGKITALFIGPEGGFTPEETANAKKYGLKARTLGKLILDSEVACIAASSLLLCSGGGV